MTTDSSSSPQYIQLPLFPMKTCTHCNRDFPANREYFHSHKQGMYGLRSQCKACYTAKVDIYRSNHKDKVAVWLKRWRSKNGEKIREYAKKHGTPEKRKAYRINHREQLREYHRLRYLHNKEKYQEQGRAWRMANPLKRRQSVNRRRAKRVLAGGFHTADQIAELHTRQDGKCFHCSVEFNGVFTEDHIIPISRGGTDWIDNIALMCQSCNSSKGTKLLHEWHPEKYPPPQ